VLVVTDDSKINLSRKLQQVEQRSLAYPRTRINVVPAVINGAHEGSFILSWDIRVMYNAALQAPPERAGHSSSFQHFLFSKHRNIIVCTIIYLSSLTISLQLQISSLRSFRSSSCPLRSRPAKSSISIQLISSSSVPPRGHARAAFPSND